MSKKQEKNEIDQNRDRIAEMFKGKNIFITGGTGFVGKMLIEKLLRCCPDLGTIYILARVKKDKLPKQRVQEIFNSPLFEKLRKARPEAVKQMHVIPGDVSLPDLGISPQDRALVTSNTNFYYHCAATTRFDETIKKAVLLNTRGTKLLLELAEESKHLEVFVHVSTAYCHLHVPVLQEQLYDPPGDPHRIIRIAEIMEEQAIENMKKELMKDIANTYVYTKALSEGLVAEKMKIMPCIITRPSIVLPIWKEPLPGWTDNLNGPTGLLIGAGKGVIRTMLCNKNNYADFFPADIASNSLLLATWNFVSNKNDARVYNLTSSSEFKTTWSEIIEMGRKLVVKVPLNGIAWYPGGSMKSSRLAHNIALLFTHWIPAYIIDGLLFMAGQKRFMIRLQDKITKGMVVFEYFANHQWDFVNQNLISLRPLQTEKEKEVYSINGDDFDEFKYFETCIHAARVHLLKEMPETLPAARKHMTRMYWIDVIVKVLFWYMIYYMLVTYSETARNVSDSVFGYVKSFVPPAIMSSGEI